MSRSAIVENLADGGLALDRAHPASGHAGKQGAETMKGGALQRRVRIRNPHGFHVRPAAAFVETASRFKSQIAVQNGDVRVDGRRVLDLMMLGAEPGVELLLEVDGADAAEAIEALAAILAAEEPPPPPLPKKG